MTSNPVGWFEIYVQDMKRAQKFYESVLNIKLDKLSPPGGSEMEMQAFPMDLDRPGAAGALVKVNGSAPGAGGTMIYFSCTDCAVEAGRVAAAGGRVQSEKASIGQYGFFALAVDTEGNVFGLHSAA